MTTLYCSSWVLPISSPPIDDGAVAVAGETIAAVGKCSLLTESFPEARVENFGDAAIIPGLINAHSHLELTALRGYIESEEEDFFDWLRKLTVARAERMTSDDLYTSSAWGACEAVRAGITCVGDASYAAYQSMTALRDVGLRATVFQESFGPDPRLVKENFEKLTTQVSRLRELETPLVRAGVSPHAPYTVCGPQLRLISEFALEQNLPLMMHAAESAAEDMFLRQGAGPFAEGLARRGISWKAPGTSAIQYLGALDILKTGPLLAHCIRVDDADIELMRATRTKVAHCPKSNAKLGHGRARFARFLDSGIDVGLGSDSVVSNNTCDILEEARFATLLARENDTSRETQRTVTGVDVLTAATAGGARAMQLEGQVGELRQNLQADLAIVSLAGLHQLPSYDPAGTLVFSSSGRDVVLTLVAGREVFRNGRVTTIDEDRLRARIKEIATKLKQ